MGKIVTKSHGRKQVPLDTLKFALKLACEDGKLKDVKDIFKQIRINYSKSLDIPLDATNATAVRVSAESKNFEIARYLLLKGANDKVTDCDENTLLHLACKTGSYNMVEFLIEKNTDCNSKNKFDETPLFFALEAEVLNTDVVRLLVSNGAFVSCKSIHGQTPIYLAHHKGNGEIVQLFLEQGDDIPREGAELGQFIFIAANNNLCSTVQLLLHRLKTSEHPNITSTLLRIAAEKNNVELMELALQYGANIDQTQAIMATVRENHKEAFLFLMSKECDLNCTDSYGKTLLHAACETKEDNSEIIEILLKSGLDPMISDCYGSIPLHYACLHSPSIEKVILVMSYTSDINVLPILHYRGYSPLLHLLMYNKKITNYHRAIDCFSQMGCNLNGTYDKLNGRTVLHLLAESKNANSLEIIQELVNFGADTMIRDFRGRIPLHYACEAGNKQKMLYLLGHTRDITAQANTGETALHMASREDLNIEVVKLLIKLGADPMLADNQGKTALHVACKFRNIETASFLLRCTSNINLQNANGHTPLHLVLSYGWNRNSCFREMLHLFLQKNASLKIKDNPGRTAVYYVKSQFELSLMLLYGANIDTPDVYGRTARNELKQRYDVTGVEEEIKDLKEDKISPKYSMYDILVKPDEVSRFVKAEVFMKIKDKKYKLKKYQYLRGHIKRQAQKALRRRRLSTQATVLLKKKLLINTLPDLCLDHILSFFTEDELREFVDLDI